MFGFVWVGDKAIGLDQFLIYRLEGLFLLVLEVLLLLVEELLERPLLLLVVLLVEALPLPGAEPRPLPPLPLGVVPLPGPPLLGGPWLWLLPLERLLGRLLMDLDLDRPLRPAGGALLLLLVLLLLVCLLVAWADFFLLEAPPFCWPLWLFFEFCWLVLLLRFLVMDLAA